MMKFHIVSRDAVESKLSLHLDELCGARSPATGAPWQTQTNTTEPLLQACVCVEPSSGSPQ